MKTPVVPEQFVMLIKGKQFVLYARFFRVAQDEESHARSVSIEQIANYENGHAAIVSAKAVTKGSVFIDAGDASPESVGADKFISHLLRVASTRSKARVLRDAYGIAMPSIEELMIGVGRDSSHSSYTIDQPWCQRQAR